MNIKELSIRNFKIIGNVDIQPVGRVILISGRNNNGKSTVFDAVMAALRGAKYVPAKPVKYGKTKGEIVCKLQGEKGVLTVTRTFSDNDGKITTSVSVMSDDKVYARPQEVLDQMLAAVSLDPSEFVLMDGKKRLATLKQLVPLTFPNGGPLDADALDERNKVDYIKRTSLNREHKEVTAEIEVLGSQLPEPSKLPAKEVDISDLAAQMAKASEHNTSIEVTRQRRQDSIARTDRNILLARKKADEARAAIAQAEADEKRFKAELSGLTKEKDAAPIDTQQLADSLNKAKDTNRLIALRAKRDELATKARRLFFETEELTNAMETRVKEKQDALARAKFPIEGLEFGEGEVIYKGQPFAQASSSDQIRVGCSIAMALRPEIRVLNIKHGSLLDKESWQVVGDMAESQDWQIWTEMVTDEKIGITMVEGAIQP